MGNLSEKDLALVAIGKFLNDEGYEFTAITPASHAIVNARETAGSARTLRDIFGWSRSFDADELPDNLLAWLSEAGELENVADRFRSKIRFSTLKSSLYIHSAFPTSDADAVFFGPDTYRFADLIERTVGSKTSNSRNTSDTSNTSHSSTSGSSVKRILDIGCGSGAGGLFLAGKLPSQKLQVFLSDINARALRYARVNAALSGNENVSVLMGDTTHAITGPLDIIISNPPYLVDSEARLYRNGGGAAGCDLSVRIVRESISLLAPGGMLIVYTGTPVVEGRHVFRDAIAPILVAAQIRFVYTEIDPDVFGEELAHPAYAYTERLAAVSLVVHR